MPRLPHALSSCALSPTSLAMLSCSSLYSMAFPAEVSQWNIGNAQFSTGTSLSSFVSYFFGNTEVHIEVLYGVLEIFKIKVHSAKISIRTSLSCFVFLFFGNVEMQLVVLYGFSKITKSATCKAKVVTRICFSSSLSPSSLAILSCNCRYSMTFLIISQMNVHDAKIGICTPFACPVSQFFRNI